MARHAQRLARLFVVTGFVFAVVAPAAHAAFGIHSWLAEVRKSNTQGDLETRAGSHPFVGVTDFTLNNNAGMADGNVKNVRVDLPPGLMSNPQATSKKCTDAQFPSCPPETKLGHVDVYVGPPVPITADVFNMVPKRGQVSDFAFDASHGTGLLPRTDIVGGVRQSDYGLFFTISDIPQNANLNRSVLTFCGFASAGNGCPQLAKPFITLPTACIGPQTTVLTVQSWNGETATANSVTPTGATDCDKLPFAPQMTVTATAQTSPKGGAGLDVKLTQASGEANTKRVSVQLPAAFSARLDTLSLACPEATFKADPAKCPAGAAAGTATAVTPLLHDPLAGSAYFVTHSGGALPTLEVILKGTGFNVFLSGSFTLGGGIKSTFDGIPDVPLSSFDLNLPAGPTSALGANDTLCDGSVVMAATIDSQSGKTVTSQVPVTVKGCTLKIVSAQVKKTRATLLVRVPSAGTLVVSGKGLKTVRRGVGGAARSKVVMKLTKSGMRTLAARRAKHRKLKVRLTARFGPAANATGLASKATKTLTFK